MFRKFLEGVFFGLGFFLVIVFGFSVYAFVAPGSGPSVDYYTDTASPIMGNITNISGEILIVFEEGAYSGGTSGGSYPAQNCFTGWTPVWNTTYTLIGGRRDSDGVSWFNDWTQTLCRLD